MATFEEAARAFVAYAKGRSPDDFWAFEGIVTLNFEQRYDELWQFVLLALELTSFDDTQVLAVIAAGPLEDIVRYSAPDFEERIVARIKADPKFRRAMTGVWCREERKDFWDRITPLLYEYPTESIDGFRNS